MSWLFNSTTDRVTLTDNAALTFPDGDWTIGGWIKLSANDGTGFQYYMSWNNFNGLPSFQAYIGEESQTDATLRNKQLFNALSSTSGDAYNYTVNINRPSTASPGSSTAWQHVLIRYKKSTNTVDYFINGAADYSWTAGSLVNGINYAGSLYFGHRSDLAADRDFRGRLAEFAKWDRYIDNTEAAQLAAGDAPSLHNTSMSWYCPMINDFTESIVGITVTNTNASTDADHPTITYTSGATINCALGTAAASGFQANVSTSITIACGVGSAASSGLTASVSQANEVVCGVGTAAASGFPATVASSISINCAVGTAVASGFTADVSTAGVTISSPADRGTLSLADCSFSANVFTLKCRFDNSVNASGQRFMYGQISGVNGLTPQFRLNRTNWEGTISTLNKFLYSYDGQTWNEFANRPASDATYFYFNHSSAFTGDSVYIASFLPWPVAYTLPWIQSLESSGYISDTPSSTNYVFGTRSATVNELGQTITAQDLYAFKIGTAGLAPDGYPKRSMVLMSGVHAAEDVGNRVLKGAVEFLLSADAQAAIVRSWFNVYVYPDIASSGRKGGSVRADFQSGYITSDVNRHWHDTTLETLVKHKAAIQADAGSVIPVKMDFHGDHFVTDPYDYYQTGMDSATWAPAIQTYRPALTQTAWNVTGTADNWFYLNKSTVISITPEYPTQTEYFSLSDAEDYGADHMRAISDIANAGYWEIAATNIVCGVGAASASGFAATVSSPLTLDMALGTAAAFGYQAYVDATIYINAGIGTASAVGYSAIVVGTTEIPLSLGVATALGYQADIWTPATWGRDSELSGLWSKDLSVPNNNWV